MITVRIPVPRGLGPNLLGLVGLIAVMVAIGGLTGNWWWSLLAAGVLAVGLAYVAHLNLAAADGPAELAAARVRSRDDRPDVPLLAAVGRS